MLEEYILKPWGRLVRQRAFMLCVVVLAICAAGLHVGAQQLKWHFRKFPLPLQKPLDELNRAKLSPYKVIKAVKISKEIEEELGTTEYIQWHLEDTSLEQGDPLRYLLLFVTYYTGDPDRVPHVPDWCYVGGGGQISTAENIELMVPHNGTGKDEVPMRILDIAESDSMGQRHRAVGYIFAVNGTYRCTRTDVRMRLNRLTDRYAYFSKVEMSVLVGGVSREQLISALTRLAQKAVPVLAAEHWPDWAAAKTKQ